MNMGGKVGRLAKGCRESPFHHTAVKICRKVMFHLIFFEWQKEGHVIISHVTREFLSVLLPLSNYNSTFNAEANENWARSLEVA